MDASFLINWIMNDQHKIVYFMVPPSHTAQDWRRRDQQIWNAACFCRRKKSLKKCFGSMYSFYFKKSFPVQFDFPDLFEKCRTKDRSGQWTEPRIHFRITDILSDNPSVQFNGEWRQNEGSGWQYSIISALSPVSVILFLDYFTDKIDSMPGFPRPTVWYTTQSRTKHLIFGSSLLREL